MRISRPATHDDIDEVVRLASVMFASMGLDATDPVWRAEAARVAQERLGGDLGVFVVDHPTESRRLVASAAASILRRLPTPRNPTGLVGNVQWVATDEEFRRQSHGRSVMTALLGWLGDRGVTAVELNATADGEPLYRSLGFREPANPHLIAVLTS